MTEAPASNKRPRVQIEEGTETNTQDPPRPAPSTMAYNIIVDAVEPHPAPIQRLCQAIFHKFSALKNKERQQLSTLSRLSEDTFLPRSARLAFELHASSKVMETEDFKTLAAKMDELTLNWKTEAKATILAVAQLESKALRAEIIACLATSALELGKLFLLKRDPAADLKIAPNLVHYALEKCGDPLFECIYSVDSATHTVDCRSVLTRLRQLLRTEDSTVPSALQKVIFNPFLGAYTTLLKKLFIESWTSQVTAHQHLASERAMAKELKTILDGDATQAAAMALDVEPTVDPKVLRDLIKTQIQSETKKIQSELNRLSQKVTRQGPDDTRPKTTAATPKKSPRGASRRASSPKKPRGRQTQTANQRRQKQKQKSPARSRNANATVASDDSKGNGSRKGKRSSSPKNKRKKQSARRQKKKDE